MAKIYLQRRKTDAGYPECYIPTTDGNVYKKLSSYYCADKGYFSCRAGIYYVFKQVIPKKLIKGDNHGLK